MLKFAVCDDQKADLDLVADKIREYYADECEIYKYEDGESLLEDSLTQSFDVLFLDIVMPGMDGMKLAAKIREENQNVKIVFVTNKEELAYMGYLYEAFRFVRKSNLECELWEAAESLKKYFDSANEYLEFKIPRGGITMAIKEIQYIEAKDHTIILVSNYEERVCGTLKEYESKLCKKGFIRIHKAYLVNLRYIYSIQKDCVKLVGGKELPLSRNRVNETKKKLQEFINSESPVEV